MGIVASAVRGARRHWGRCRRNSRRGSWCGRAWSSPLVRGARRRWGPWRSRRRSDRWKSRCRHEAAFWWSSLSPCLGASLSRSGRRTDRRRRGRGWWRSSPAPSANGGSAVRVHRAAAIAGGADVGRSLHRVLLVAPVTASRSGRSGRLHRPGCRCGSSSSAPRVAFSRRDPRCCRRPRGCVCLCSSSPRFGCASAERVDAGPDAGAGVRAGSHRVLAFVAGGSAVGVHARPAAGSGVRDCSHGVLASWRRLSRSGPCPARRRLGCACWFSSCPRDACPLSRRGPARRPCRRGRAYGWSSSSPVSRRGRCRCRLRRGAACWCSSSTPASAVAVGVDSAADAGAEPRGRVHPPSPASAVVVDPGARARADPRLDGHGRIPRQPLSSILAPTPARTCVWVLIVVSPVSRCRRSWRPLPRGPACGCSSFRLPCWGVDAAGAACVRGGPLLSPGPSLSSTPRYPRGCALCDGPQAAHAGTIRRGTSGGGPLHPRGSRLAEGVDGRPAAGADRGGGAHGSFLSQGWMKRGPGTRRGRRGGPGQPLGSISPPAPARTVVAVVIAGSRAGWTTVAHGWHVEPFGSMVQRWPARAALVISIVASSG